MPKTYSPAVLALSKFLNEVCLMPPSGGWSYAENKRRAATR